MKTYNKLVRDRIPQIIAADGKRALCETMGEEAFLAALESKLREETNEYLLSPSMEEMADILEVIEAICRARGFDAAALDRVKAEKRAKRGGFEARVLLRAVLDQDET